MVSYNKLWKLLVDKNMTKSDLISLASLSTNTVAKMSKKEEVNTSTLVKICEALKCNITEILELMPNTVNQPKNKSKMDIEQFTLFDFADNKKNSMTVRFIDLFAGLGGTRLGLEQACSENLLIPDCVMTSEIKPYAIQALEENFGHKNLLGDIRQIDEKKLPDFDIVLGGFPCQAFSTAGKGLGFLDTRGTLFFEIERILREKKPYGFIFENVDGLVTHDDGKTFKTILAVLDNLGYIVNWKILNSQDYGVAQTRKRVYIVGTKDTKIDLDIPIQKKVTFGEISEKGMPVITSHFTKCLLEHYSADKLYGKAIKDKRGGENNIHSWDIELKGEISKEQKQLMNKLFKERRKKCWAEQIGIKWMDGMPLTATQISTFFKNNNLTELLDDLVEKGYLVKEHPKQLKEQSNGAVIREQDKTKPLGYNIVAGKLSFEFTKILDAKDVAPTLVAMDAAKLGVVDNNGIRHLTLKEGLRMFGYPENYTLNFIKNKKQVAEGFDLLGNTVTVSLIKMISLRLLNAYKVHMSKKSMAYDNEQDNLRKLVVSN